GSLTLGLHEGRHGVLGRVHGSAAVGPYERDVLSSERTLVVAFPPRSRTHASSRPDRHHARPRSRPARLRRRQVSRPRRGPGPTPFSPRQARLTRPSPPAMIPVQPHP